MFRHGETDWNLNDLLQGSSDTSLNKTGLAQAEELAKNLTDSKIETILSSDLERAHTTAKIVASHLDIDIETSEGLRETHFGETEGGYWPDIKEKYPEFFEILYDFDHPDCFHASVPGGESRHQTFTRSSKAIKDFVQKNKDAQTLAISTHGALLNTFLVKHLNENLRFGNCEFIKLHYDTDYDQIFKP